ncbi:glutamine synthetase [Venturia nashicola]|nr:glutamine synthetase [Venturia nashicola]
MTGSSKAPVRFVRALKVIRQGSLGPNLLFESRLRTNRTCAKERKGYSEDRGPASEADPYQITGIIVKTTN